MRFYHALLLLVIICACSNSKNKIAFDGLIGTWHLIQDDKETVEEWEKISSVLYHGKAKTYRDQEIIWQESVKLYEVNGEWIYEVSVSDQHEEPVAFKVIEGNNSFSATNPENNFPRIINYSMYSDSIKAFITNGAKDTIFFNYSRLK